MVGRATAVAVLLVAGLGAGSAEASGVQSLEVLSGRADLVSGGDALVAAKVSGPATVDVNGVDVTGAFAVRPSGRLEGLVTGLKVGENVLTVRDSSGGGKRTHDHEPSDRRPGLLRPADHALRLQSERVEPAARRGDRRAVQRTDAGRAAVPQHGQPVRAVRPGGHGHPADHDRPRTDRAVHRPARHRHRQPRHLPDGRARGPGQADRAVVGRAALERQALLHVRRRVRHRAPPARAGQRAAGAATRRGLRGRHLEPEHLRQQLQRRGLGRGGDDDQGDRRRALRAAEVHDRQRRLGGDDAAAPAGRELPRPARRAHDEPGLRGPLDAGAGLARLPRAHALLLADQPAEQSGPRHRAAQRALPHRGRAPARVGLESHEPGQPVRAEGAGVRRRPHGARADRERRLRPAAGAGLAPGRPTRPASAAASPTSCARCSASRSRRTRRTARASWPSTTSACSTGSSR